MTKEELLKEAAQAVVEADEDRAVELANKALADGFDPVEVLTQGFSAGINEMGDLFGRGEVFLPEMIMSAGVMQAASDILNSALKKEDAKAKGKMVIATVEGDVHDIGKGIVIALVQTQGVEVIDLGRDVSVEKLIDAAEEHGANIIGTSALLTTTMTNQEKLEKELKARGLRDKYKTIVGGSPCTQRWADKIGADAFAEDAAEGVTKVMELLAK